MKFYSREELLPEIVGEKIYEASPTSAKQAIHRIDNIIRKMSSYNDTNGIPENRKEQYVNLMKCIYNNDKIKSIISKMDRGKTVLEEEYIYLFDFLLEGVEDENERSLYEYYRREFVGKEIEDEIDSIYKTIIRFTKNNICLPYEIQIEILKNLHENINNYINANHGNIELLKLFPTTEQLVDGFAEEMKKKYNYKKKWFLRECL